MSEIKCKGELGPHNAMGHLDNRVYDDIKLYRANGRAILTIGGYEWVLTPEQEAQFREQLHEVKLKR